MHVCFVMVSDGLGGTQRSVATQAQALAEAGHRVDIVVVLQRDVATFFDVPGIDYRYLVDARTSRPFRVGATDDADRDLDARLWTLPTVLTEPGEEVLFNRLTDQELERWLRTLRCDVLITTAPVLLSLATRLTDPSVTVVHQEHRTSELRGHSLPSLLAAGPRADALVFLTERTAQWFRSSMGRAAPPIHVMPNALPAGARPRSGLTSRTIVWAGRFVAEKQPSHVIDAFAALHEKHPDWTLRLYGEGPLSGALRRQAQTLGLADKVQMPGSTHHMEREWAKASVGVLTSMVEGFPMVLLEAMAAGVPFVSYDCPNGPAAIIEDSVTGRLVSPGDVGELADAFIDLADDDTRTRMGAAAWDASRQYDARLVATRWQALLERLVTTRRRHGDAPGLARAARHAVGEVDLVRGSNPVDEQDPATARAAEAALLADDPTRRLIKGRIYQSLGHRQPWQISDLNLQVLTSALDAAEVPWTLVPSLDPAVPTVAVPSRHRDAALRSLADRHSGEPLYLQAARPTRVVGPAFLAGDDPAAALAQATIVRVYQLFTNPAQTMLVDASRAAQIEFWQPAEDDADLLVAPRNNRIVERVPAAALEAEPGQRPAAATAFGALLQHDIDFPIDAVYMWVDGADPRWQERRDRALGIDPDTTRHDESANPARFRSRDELRYSLRSLATYAPWIRHVYLVTDGQRPAWLAEDCDRLTVVDHSEIALDAADLPVFNSHAIAAMLHRIPGLSEHYLIMNDDVFFGRAAQPGQYFTPAGQSKFFPSSVKIPYGPADPGNPPHEGAQQNVRALLADRFGRRFTQAFLHTPHAQQRSLQAELEEVYAEPLRRTARSRFRSWEDVEAAMLHHYHGAVVGRTLPGQVNYHFINVARQASQLQLSRLLRTREADVFCLNDFHVDGEQTLADEVLTGFMAAYFPVPSDFERPDVP